MIAFTRKVSTWGDPREVGDLARRLAALVSDRTSVPTALWVGVSGTPAGALLYTAFYENLAEFTAARAALLTDPEYAAAVAETRQYVAAPPEDRHLQIVHNSGGEYRRPPVGGFLRHTVGCPAPGRFGAARRWGLELSDLVAEITGSAGLFGPTIAGPFGELNWVGVAPDAAAFDAQHQAIGKNDRYVAKLDETADLFRGESVSMAVYQRVA